MTLDEAINHFGSQRKLATKLRVSEPTISNWKVRGGEIPDRHQLMLQIITNGGLKADEKIFARNT